MSTASAIARANKAQHRAIAPDVSVWVTASAGSGKTKVLTDRVLSLLLAGTKPNRILCLTFTKAAAAEMNNRIAERLAAWVTASEDDLHKDLAPLVQGALDNPTREDRDRILKTARRLFAVVLDAPGGLQISTLHAFCQSLLRRFPLEARVPPHFALMDERDSAEALDNALEDTIAHARAGGDEDLHAALNILTARVHESNFSDLLGALVASRGKLSRMFDAYGGVDGAVAAVRRTLGLAPTDTENTIIAAACAEHAFDSAALRRVVDALRAGSNADAERGAQIATWLSTPDKRLEFFNDYARTFLTQDGVPKAPKYLATQKACKALPDAVAIMMAEAVRVEAVMCLVKAVRVADGTAALMRIGFRVLDIYEEDKIRHGLMDYDDLIQTTRRLLSMPGVAEWVLYKLDGGIDHILIDEAQDTNPDQWAIVTPIRTEFFAGQGRHEDRARNPRTIFAVGDRKQSIYSFQGAAPEEFDRQRVEISHAVVSAHCQWQDVVMNVSFRSVRAVLDAVNVVYKEGTARLGVAAKGENITHMPARDGHAGLVEVWPLVEPQATDDGEGWKPPVERRRGDSPQSRLAAQIVQRIKRMVDDKEILESQNRPIRPGDIMVLVRRRTGFVEDLVRHLKNMDIAVAGVDRMVLTEQMAVMDLVALGQFLLLPEDDLTLATVLKGPLIGLTEEELFVLAYNRGEKRLWDVLSVHAGTSGPFGKAHKELADLLAKTDYLTPAELYGHILVARDGRRKLLARLGMDADDPIDEFMNLALAYQRGHPPTLQGFLHWVAAGDTEIKRDLEQSGSDAVRVITVHGAKGLQAPIVFMPDTAQKPTMRNPLLWTDDATPLLLWAAKADELDPLTADVRETAKAAQDHEYHRLMYVAMTRAEDRLYVCGWATKRGGKLDETWYGLIKAGITSVPHDIDGDIVRLTSPQTDPPKTPEHVKAEAAQAPLPAWAQTQPLPEDTPSKPLAPSKAVHADPAALSPLQDDGKHRYQRGIIIHRLLQSLPDLPPARRRAAAEAFVKRPGWGLADEAAATIVTETLRVLDEPAFAPLFAAGSRAEVSVTGLVGKHAISGQVDRLAVTADTVWIIDYKTNRPPPRETEKVDPAYVFQMATYRAALKVIYPRHTVRCVLLWTDGPFVMELEAARMDGVLRDAGLL